MSVMWVSTVHRPRAKHVSPNEVQLKRLKPTPVLFSLLCEREKQTFLVAPKMDKKS